MYYVQYSTVLEYLFYFCTDPLLWTSDKLTQIVTKQGHAPFTPTLTNQVLNKVQVLLLTVNKNEFHVCSNSSHSPIGHMHPRRFVTVYQICHYQRYTMEPS